MCGKNAQFLTCGSACVETCTHRPEICIAVCKAGCFCEKGYVRESDKTDSPCIKQEECRKPTDVPQCGENEQFSECASSCPPTCKDWSYPLPKPPKICNKMCNRGCFCKHGFYRSNNGKCVQREECCSESEMFTDCGSACVETCDDKPQICTEQCVAGCYCKQVDYVRQNNSTGSSCIHRNQCPK